MACSDTTRGLSYLNDCPSPTRDEPNFKLRGIKINPLDYGFIVEVGCQSFAISDAKELITKLTKYINNPQETEKTWMEKKKI